MRRNRMSALIIVLGLTLVSFQNCSKAKGFRTIASTSAVSTYSEIPGEGPSVPEQHMAVVLAWDKVIHQNLAGYRLYYGTSPGTIEKMIDVGLTGTPDTPEYKLPPLDPRIPYFFVVKAYTKSGVESSSSQEILIAAKP